jgi:hypothetical protein
MALDLSMFFALHSLHWAQWHDLQIALRLLLPWLTGRNSSIG